MIEVETVDALSTIKLLEAIEALYPMLALIHVFLDTARYHHAKLVQDWLAQAGRRVVLHFIPAYCLHLNPIGRLWGVMHKRVKHNKRYATCREFVDATLDFLRGKIPRNWAEFGDSVTDNFRVISPNDFRVVTSAGYSHRFGFISGSLFLEAPRTCYDQRILITEKLAFRKYTFEPDRSTGRFQPRSMYFGFTRYFSDSRKAPEIARSQDLLDLAGVAG
jgi:hypothetical protein